jgi:hypothetical protein
MGRGILIGQGKPKAHGRRRGGEDGGCRIEAGEKAGCSGLSTSIPE